MEYEVVVRASREILVSRAMFSKVRLPVTRNSRVGSEVTSIAKYRPLEGLKIALPLLSLTIFIS
ncbi:MAG: hypothetical protein QXE66_00565 [Desulfurococcaceae archaeon]